MSEIQRRIHYSNKKVASLLTDLLARGVDEFSETSICMTGSYGRLEASDRSDLDVFLISADQDPDAANPEHANAHTRILKPRLTHLDEVRLKSRLIEAARAIGLKDFDSDGRYLINHSTSALIGMIGRVADDANNTFTSRMLLLLEGRALTNPGILEQARKAIIASYWRDYRGPGVPFTPAFMSNDILRMWRTFCVNYEARTASIPAEQRNKRRLKNYKLKYSRMLTCYSAILSMLDVYRLTGSVSPEDMQEICLLPPCERLQTVKANASTPEAISALEGALQEYEQFLHNTDRTEEALLEALSDPHRSREMLEASYRFADSIFRSINAIGNLSKLHRMVVV